MSVGVSAFIALLRFKNIDISFKPYTFLLFIGFGFEVLGVLLIHFFKNNLLIGNIYVLFESIILLWQFILWSISNNTKRRYLFFCFLFLSVWIFDNLILNNITTVNSLFRVFYSLVIVFLSIEQINFVFVTERNNVLLNARFLITSAFIIFYTYKAVFEVFYMINIKMSDRFYNSLFQVLILINLFTNLIFAFAVLCIPKKQKFMLPF
jgi:hypothetical protein